jgi:hypothetical protein
MYLNQRPRRNLNVYSRSLFQGNFWWLSKVTEVRLVFCLAERFRRLAMEFESLETQRKIDLLLYLTKEVLGYKMLRPVGL